MADTLDILTLAEAKLEVNIASSDTTQDTELANYITAVSRRIDSLCGPVVNRTFTTETYYVGGCDRYIDLRTYPVSSVTAVVEYDAAGNATTLTGETVSTKQASGFLLDVSVRRPRRIYRRASGVTYQFPAGGAVTVTYVAGRAANTAAADPVFKNAAASVFGYLWRNRQGIGSDTFGATDVGIIPPFALPRGLLEGLSDELLPVGVA
jgi:hypothetical protein